MGFKAQEDESLALKLIRARALTVDLASQNIPEMISIVLRVARTAKRPGDQLKAAGLILKLATAEEFKNASDSELGGEDRSKPTQIIVVDRADLAREGIARFAGEGH